MPNLLKKENMNLHLLKQLEMLIQMQHFMDKVLVVRKKLHQKQLQHQVVEKHFLLMM